ncbi:late competence development ComFB family protein [Crocosphaera sp. XPORK-15E]|uniref:late competence development ComFB family protein n=1 Tax=Crocosphaera sp. XPORK-15E TaxID=3110247 RepID=UPI002B1FFEEA|nr:late competence development ComFB family protein [Crocosphaera sp. XPORK-15E]MEA5533023.1 late competence development ComFB family protein [Crocosphaera sp. XPORK-15E]
MSIQNIIDQALKDGYLTPTMEKEVGRICESAAELPMDEYMALDRLMGALLTGEVKAVPRKQFINVMEELALGEAINRIAELESKEPCQLDVGDIAAYALNRLPPLYATTQEGAEYQRQRAKEELQNLIAQQVEEGIQRYLSRPMVPGRNPLEKTQRNDIFEKMTDLLKSLAPD